MSDIIDSAVDEISRQRRIQELIIKFCEAFDKLTLAKLDVLRLDLDAFMDLDTALLLDCHAKIHETICDICDISLSTNTKLEAEEIEKIIEMFTENRRYLSGIFKDGLMKARSR